MHCVIPTFINKQYIYLDGGTEENCGILSLMWEGWNDWICNIPPTHPILCACEKSGSVYLKLRGRCSESVIDTYWTVQTEMGRYFLHGIKTSVIKYDDDNKKWNLRSFGEIPVTSAASDSSYHSFLMGKSKWLISDDQSMKFFTGSRPWQHCQSLLSSSRSAICPLFMSSLAFMMMGNVITKVKTQVKLFIHYLKNRDLE